MINLSVSPSELRASASELKTLRQQHLDVMKRLRILVMSLSEDWKGEASEAFTNKFLSHNQTMNNVSNVLEQYADLLEQVADEAEAMDNTLLSSVRNRLN